MLLTLAAGLNSKFRSTVIQMFVADHKMLHGLLSLCLL